MDRRAQRRSRRDTAAADRHDSADGGSDRRSHRGAAADRDQALRRRSRAVARASHRRWRPRSARFDGVVDVFDGIVLAGDALTMQVDRTRPRWRASIRRSSPTARSAGSPGRVTTECAGERQARRDPRRGFPRRTARTASADLDDCGSVRRTDIAFRCRGSPPSRRQIGQPQITRDNLKTMVAVTGANQRPRSRLDHRRRARTRSRLPGLLAERRLLRARRRSTRSSRRRSAASSRCSTSAVALVFIAAAVPVRTLPRRACDAADAAARAGRRVHRTVGHGHRAQHHRDDGA